MTTVSPLFRRTLRAGGREVPLLAGPSALAELQPTLKERGFKGRLWVVAGDRPLALHGETLRRALPDTPILEIPGDESSKDVAHLAQVWDWLVESGAKRSDAVLAFGGGAVSDMAGFAAATYMRGIGVINVPTTLLAQVDASVGGKTAINHPRGKNLIGAFHQPLAVVADTDFLTTLAPRDFAAGMAEIAKIAMALDAPLFEELEREVTALTAQDGARLTPIIGRAIELKAEIVERDEREDGDRMLLNYGHTIGHAVEAASGYGKLLHGEAVAIGMEAVSYMAQELGMLDAASAKRELDLSLALHLPTQAHGLEIENVLGRLLLDKKRGDRQRWVLAERIGHAIVRDDVPDDLVRRAVERVVPR